MQTVLITAFEPFNNETENPTQSVLSLLPDFLFDAKVIKISLPVVYKHAFDVLLPYIEEYNPDVLLMLGLAAGRTQVNIERIAINVMDSKMPDNLDNIHKNRTIEPMGQDGYFTNLPLDKIINRLHKKDLPAQLSSTAGTYVCNDLMYRVMHHIKTLNLSTKAGFIHIPYLPHQVLDKPSMPSLERQHTVSVITEIIDVLINPIELSY